MSTGAIRAIRKSCPDATIVYATWEQNKPLLELNPDIDHVVPVGAYRLKDFDAWVDIRHEELMDELPDVYWGELHFGQFQSILPDLERPEDFRPVLYIAPDDYKNMERESDKPLIVVNGWSRNGVNWRLWDFRKWQELISRFRQNDCVVVQLGGPDDPGLPGVNARLSLPLRQSVGVLTHASLVVGIDSFLMHAAGARIFDSVSGELVKDGVPGVLLAGPIDSRNVVPDGSLVVAYSAAVAHCPDGQSCGESRPTEELPICQYQNACMRLLEVEEVWQSAKKLLTN